MVQTKKFSKRKENFTCEQCGVAVQGDGFTNHCPLCLWSKHVDVNPGDRNALCQGMMKPICVESKAGSYILVHECTRCGFQKRNKTVPADNFEALLALASQKTP